MLLTKTDRIKSSKRLSGVICFFIFSLMLMLNCFTPKCVDDYSYMISLASIEKINGLRDIFPSLYVHAFTMNGRLVSHFMVYVFDWLPKVVFNILNAGMFLMLVFLSYRIASQEVNNYLLILIFCLIWLFELDFGQVNLWLTGSCNYLWGHVFNLLIIFPFYNLFSFNKTLKGKSAGALLASAFLIGAYNEVASFAALFVCSAFLILSWKKIKSNQRWIYFFTVVLYGLGFLSVFLSPAEHGKSGDIMSLNALLNGILRSAKVYLQFMPLIVLWGVLAAILAGKKQVKNRRFFSSVIFLCGSVCANFVLSAASGYPGRCAAMSLILLVIADGILLCGVPSSAKYDITALLAALAIPFFGVSALFGIYDIYNTGKNMRRNEQIIAEASLQGKESVTIPCVYPATKYSAIYNLKYIDMERADIWPNENMATYFGIMSVEGKE